jgi:hypothetical protein
MAALFSGRRHGYGWGGAIVSAGAALLIPGFGYRKFWVRGRFWAIFALLAVLQVPVVIAVVPLVEQFRFIFGLAFGALDCMFVITVIYWTVVQQGDDKN